MDYEVKYIKEGGNSVGREKVEGNIKIMSQNYYTK